MSEWQTNFGGLGPARFYLLMGVLIVAAIIWRVVVRSRKRRK